MSLVLGALGLELRYGARLLRWGCDEIVEFAHAVPRVRARRAHDRAVKKAAAAGEHFVASPHAREGSRTFARWVGARPESEFYYHDFVVYLRHGDRPGATDEVHLLREGAVRRSLRFVSEAPYDDSLTSEQALAPT